MYFATKLLFVSSPKHRQRRQISSYLNQPSVLFLNFCKEKAMAKGKELSILSGLPEGCTSNIISFTSPKDASILSAVSSSFKAAAESDTVWEQFLPPDYQDILARSLTPVVYYSKKELYFHLCDSPLLLDGGKLSFRLSKPSGKKCYMLGARELNIIWAETPAYWQWKNIAESRFAEVAELLSVCWLEVYGKMQTRMLSSNTNYAAYLVFKIQDSYGLNSSSKAFVKLVQTEVCHELVRRIVGVENNVRTVYLEHLTHRRGRWRNSAVQNIDARMPQVRRDGWMEIELGEYFIDEGNGDEILMYLGETRQLHGKSGLIIEGIELRPKE